MNNNTKPKFSIVVIAKNEAKTLPRLVGSLKEFQTRGGEIVCLDTGSKDGTADIARKLGCKVEEVGEKYITTITKAQADAINTQFIVEDEQPILKEGDRLFDYASARNYAATLASENFVAMPDCDEMFTKFNIDKINEAIEEGAGRLEYNFTFAHDSFGNEMIKFLHSKFYQRTAFEWRGVVHECLFPTLTPGPSKFIDETLLKLEHWQNHETNRGNYLPGLALDCYQNPTNDRNSHYYARELMWCRRPKSAIKEFKRHIEMDKWPAEIGQSMIYIGDCYKDLNNELEATHWWHAGFVKDGSRREALMHLARHFWTKNSPQHTAAYATAALTISWNGFYSNNMAHYTFEPHEYLYWAKWYLGDKEGSKEHWLKALEYQPGNDKFLKDSCFYYSLPRVSIVIPTLGREDKLKNLLELITKNVNYTNYEVIVEPDSFDNRQGCPKTLKKGITNSTGELVMFLGNDCEPQYNFLLSAVITLLRKWKDRIGLVGLNDGFWKNGEIATHWLASKQLLPLIGGEFFHTGYNHVGCDSELTARCKKLGRYAWDKYAQIKHVTYAQSQVAEEDDVAKLAWNAKSVAADRKLLEERAKEFKFELL
ncbi:MAG: glycosyltransferase [Lentisphaerota bacterium]